MIRKEEKIVYKIIVIERVMRSFFLFPKNRKESIMTKFIDSYNCIIGAIVTLATALFGTYWYVFAGFLLLNIVDWLTGWYKARLTGKETSKIGLKGILKKTGYWVIILVAFLIPSLFIRLGQDLLGVDLRFLTLLGWFTLATLLVNEIRSILENLVQCGYNVPTFLIKGLAVAEKLLENGIQIEDTVETEIKKE